MLELEHLTVRYGSGRDALTAVDGVSLEIPRGTTIGLVGESGSGKSTLGRAIVGLLPVAGGALRLDGQDVTAIAARNAPAFRRRVQMVFQDPHASLNPRMSVGQAIAEGVKLRGAMTRAERRQETLRLLDLVELGQSTLHRYPHEFSGGQRQRISIARALAVQPELIVLDEVTSALDVSVQATILNLLRSLQQELGLSYLFISHNLSVVSAMSDSIAVMYLGRVVEQAETTALFTRSEHPYTRSLIGSVPRFGAERVKAPLRGDLPDPRNPPPGCRFHTRCPIGPRANPEHTICNEQDPQTDASERVHEAACHFARTRAGVGIPS